MKVRNKTELRRMIKKAAGTTGELDYIEFYDDGTWARTSGNTHSEHYAARRRLQGFASYSGYRDYPETIDESITGQFRDVEEQIEGR